MARTVDAVLLVVTLACGALTAKRWRQVMAVQPVAVSQAAVMVTTSHPFDADSLDLAVERTVNGDPFRLSRTPSEVPYSPDAMLTPAVAVPRFVPTLVLRGIVGGPPWQAVIDGIPGSPPGVVVRSGSVFDKLTIKWVSRDSVAVQTPDSAWTLTLSKGSP
jgi:hypothetical protein